MCLQARNLRFLDWREVDLELETGEVASLRGESGSGKSLLLRSIADLIPNEGKVTFGGRDRDAFSPNEWRRSVAYLPAEILWWEDTVGAHFLNEPEAGLLNRLRLPEEALSWSPSRLSMGERQRLGILRLLDRQPSVLLLDEPTANLDEAATSVVEELLLEYIRDQTACALWATHSSDQAERVSKRGFRMQDKSLSAMAEGGVAK